MKKFDFNISEFASILNTNNISLEEIGDGNLNFVYKLSDSQNTYALKHAKPYLKMLGEDFKLTPKRIIAEMNSMEYFYSLSPDFVPKIHFQNDEKYYFVMDYLSEYISLRKSPSSTQIYAKLGEFLYALSTNKPKEKRYFECDELKNITKNFVFEYPFIKNHKDLVIKDYAPQTEFSSTFLKNKERLKEVFLHSKTSLIHGDFHTDSIMVKNDNIAIIDSEFSLFCEVSFDIGNLLAHTIFSEIGTKNSSYQEKILLLLKKFETSQKLLQNSIGFCAIEMARRLYVPAKSKDLENAPNKKEAYQLSFKIANDLGNHQFNDVDSFLIRLEQYL